MSTDTAAVRGVTDAEVAAFRRDGWVKLDGLISPDLAAELLERAEKKMGVEGDAHQPRSVDQTKRKDPWFLSYSRIADEDELFGRVAFGEDMGRVVQRLLRRDVSVRVYNNTIAVKLGQSHTKASGKTNYHQDAPGHPLDRVSYLAVWLALAEVTPEMGSMNFYTGSHAMGALGDRGPNEAMEITEEYPFLAEDYALSAQVHYKPGDATVHHGYMVHGATGNTTDKPRWAMITTYFAGDTRFNGAVTHVDGDLREKYGLQPGEPFDHPAFRLVCP